METEVVGRVMDASKAGMAAKKKKQKALALLLLVLYKEAVRTKTI